MKKSKSRRSFLKKVTLSSAALTTAPYIFGNSYEQKFELSKHYSQVNYSTNNQINLGLIGCGMQGIYDTMTALKVNGVKLVAVCDLYSGRLDRAKELWDNNITVTRDYRKLLERKDIDAIIVATQIGRASCRERV